MSQEPETTRPVPQVGGRPVVPAPLRRGRAAPAQALVAGRIQPPAHVGVCAPNLELAKALAPAVPGLPLVTPPANHSALPLLAPREEAHTFLVPALPPHSLRSG